MDSNTKGKHEQDRNPVVQNRAKIVHGRDGEQRGKINGDAEGMGAWEAQVSGERRREGHSYGTWTACQLDNHISRPNQ